jgi:hypothetical protein
MGGESAVRIRVLWGFVRTLRGRVPFFGRVSRARVSSRGRVFHGRAIHGLVLAGLWFGCDSTPLEQERLRQSVIVTSRDDGADFLAFRTFFIRPGVRVLEDPATSVAGTPGAPSTAEVPDSPSADSPRGAQQEVLPDLLSEPLLQATRENLLDRGYSEAAESGAADLGMDLIYVRSAYTDYLCNNWGDWTYWGFAGWSYYFPYSCTSTSWQGGMLVTHAIDLASARERKAAAPDTFGVLRGVWFAGVYGLEVESAAFVTGRALVGIDESFEQSPYFRGQPELAGQAGGEP